MARTSPACALLLIAASTLAQVAYGASFIWGLEDLSFSQRQLKSLFQHNFGASIDTQCFRSSYVSPYRVYSTQLTPADQFNVSTLTFQLRTVQCPVVNGQCCGQDLDKLVIRAGDLKHQVTQVILGGAERAFTVDDSLDEGIVIPNVGISADPGQTFSLVIAINGNITSFQDLCPQGRYPGSCDYIAYSQSRTCCLHRTAVSVDMLPSNDTEPTYGPSPPMTEQCCIDDITQAPYRLDFIGSSKTGSDTAFDYQLWVQAVDPNVIDYDGKEPGSCGNMDMSQMMLSVYDWLPIKSVVLNGSEVEVWDAKPSAKNSIWVTVPFQKQKSQLNPSYPIDLTIVVRGNVDQLCPATDFMKSKNACEYVLLGNDGAQACCPHHITHKKQIDDCNCIDDLDRAPYRLEYVKHQPTVEFTTYTFSIGVKEPVSYDTDGYELGGCDKMTLDYAQIQIYNGVKVSEVAWNGRLLPFDTAPHTPYSSWLNIYGLHTYNPFMPKFVQGQITITMEGWVNEPCPANWQWSSQGPVCEYVLHGKQSMYNCCPHGLTVRGKDDGDDCGCRDDLSETPYRISYVDSKPASDETSFALSLDVVDPAASPDFDGQDFSLNHEVDCSSMGVQDIKIAIYPWYQVSEVKVNNVSLDAQLTPNTPYSNWLWILGVDLDQAKITPDAPLDVQVTVSSTKGKVTELCPAAAKLGSASNCEYVITNLSGDHSKQCCPKGVSQYCTSRASKSL